MRSRNGDRFPKLLNAAAMARAEPGDRHPQVAPGALPGRAAFDPGRRGWRALALVTVAVAVVSGYLAWQARPQAAPVALPATPHPATYDPAAASPALIVVAVSGLVQQPGLVRLPTGARVADALAAAGGALPEADLTTVNLARVLRDGELIAIGVPGMSDALPAGQVPLNSATAAQLEQLPGVGPVLAQRIIDYRERRGGFRAVTELREVPGIGAATFEQLKELVTL